MAFTTIDSSQFLTCEQQTHFRSSLLSVWEREKEATTGNASAVRRLPSSLLASKVTNSHQSPRHIVVQIHHNTGRVSCSAAFSRVDKFRREFDSILNVITASSPLPTLFSLSGVFLVAPTVSAQFAGATRMRYSICHTSWRNGMNKCGFPGS